MNAIILRLDVETVIRKPTKCLCPTYSGFELQNQLKDTHLMLPCDAKKNYNPCAVSVNKTQGLWEGGADICNIRWGAAHDWHMRWRAQRIKEP